ncbi:MAG: Nif11-like leader peptide family natural product precursor [Atopobiaceae bacterium]|nr:Nif11-like leader peptide family natural product precursor [Atopobiaceae bacterium]
MTYEDLTDEQKELLDKCETPEDILKLAKQEGYSLSVEELDAINGGRVNPRSVKSNNASKWSV